MRKGLGESENVRAKMSVDYVSQKGQLVKLLSSQKLIKVKPSGLQVLLQVLSFT